MKFNLNVVLIKCRRFGNYFLITQRAIQKLDYYYFFANLGLNSHCPLYYWRYPFVNFSGLQQLLRIKKIFSIWKTIYNLDLSNELKTIILRFSTILKNFSLLIKSVLSMSVIFFSSWIFFFNERINVVCLFTKIQHYYETKLNDVPNVKIKQRATIT